MINTVDIDVLSTAFLLKDNTESRYSFHREGRNANKFEAVLKFLLVEEGEEPRFKIISIHLPALLGNNEIVRVFLQRWREGKCSTDSLDRNPPGKCHIWRMCWSCEALYLSTPAGCIEDYCCWFSWLRIKWRAHPSTANPLCCDKWQHIDCSIIIGGLSKWNAY